MTASPQTVAPVLVFAWGNPSRGDDALGPLLAEQLQELLGDSTRGQVQYLTDFQLQVEHALDLVGRQHVLFVDASMRAQAPFEVSALHAEHDVSYTTHAMSPQAVMQVYRQICPGQEPPPCTLLAVRGDEFNLGDPPSPAALAHLRQALAWAQEWLAQQTRVPSADASACALATGTIDA